MEKAINEALKVSSALVSVDEFKNEMKQLNYNFINATINNNFNNKYSIGKEELENLNETCSIDGLKCDFESNLSFFCDPYSLVPPECPLKSIKIQRTKSETNEINHIGLLTSEERELLKITEDQMTEPLVDKHEAILSVVIMNNDKKQQEFLVYGSQTLTSLRDRIYCPFEHIAQYKDCNISDLNNVDNYRNDEITYSGFFFIEKTFYNDLRYDKCKDYSKPIIEHYNKRKYGQSKYKQFAHLSDLKAQKMENTTFNQLVIRIGYPYLYTHLGDCEHLIIFRDLRMINMAEILSVSCYPKIIFKSLNRRRRCFICQKKSAKWMTRNDSLVYNNPAFFCELCFDLLHFDPNGQRVGDFISIPFPKNYII